MDVARRNIARRSEPGIDLIAITQQLQGDGVAAFAKPFDALMRSIAAKKETLNIFTEAIHGHPG